MLLPTLCALTVVLGGCGAHGPDVPTLDSEARLATGGDDVALAAQQARTAEALAACLEAEGIQTDSTGRSIPDGFSVEFVLVTPVPQAEERLVVMPSGWVEESPKYQNDTPRDTSKPVLIDGDRDLSAELGACIESSGYFVPDARADLRDEERAKQAVAEASNDWARCARENGWPDVRDAEVAVDDYATVPFALVPGDITVEQLRVLLGKCSPLDPDTDLTAGNMIEEGKPTPIDPNIEFDLPQDDPQQKVLKDAIMDHIEAMYQEARS
ncbi:MAG: hypothetical protein LBC97_12465 [Bifidobacteriaceae bacterium]|nr:hypothetical protein [Bifidobacteriaceae bacterium]